MCGESVSPLGQDDSKLTQQPAELVDKPSPLFYQQLTKPMQTHYLLLLDRLNGNGTHIRTICRLADRGGVIAIILLAADESFDVLGWDKSHIVSHILEATRPVMRPATSFHRDNAKWLLYEPRQQLAPTKLFAHSGTTMTVDGVNLKYLFGEIDADHRYLFHGLNSSAAGEVPNTFIVAPSAGAVKWWAGPSHLPQPHVPM